MIYLIYGEDSLSVEEMLASLRAAAASDELYDVNTTTLDGASVSLAELEAAWSTIPFLADRRTVMVRGCWLGWNAGAAAALRAHEVSMRSGRT